MFYSLLRPQGSDAAPRLKGPRSTSADGKDNSGPYLSVGDSLFFPVGYIDGARHGRFRRERPWKVLGPSGDGQGWASTRNEVITENISISKLEYTMVCGFCQNSQLFLRCTILLSGSGGWPAVAAHRRGFRPCREGPGQLRWGSTQHPRDTLQVTPQCCPKLRCQVFVSPMATVVVHPMKDQHVGQAVPPESCVHFRPHSLSYVMTDSVPLSAVHSCSVRRRCPSQPDWG